MLYQPGDDAASAVAKSIMAEMGISGEPAALDESAPLKSSDLGSATVVVVLGLDKAGQSLLPLGGDTSTVTSEVAITAAATETSVAGG